MGLSTSSPTDVITCAKFQHEIFGGYDDFKKAYRRKTSNAPYMPHRVSEGPTPNEEKRL